MVFTDSRPPPLALSWDWKWINPKGKETKIMGDWLFFCFGGIIGFCLGIICMIWLMSMGETEMALEGLEASKK